jgi:cytoplasmic iron level regulating protein YaaA (DUF328/UPF0246 family)
MEAEKAMKKAKAKEEFWRRCGEGKRHKVEKAAKVAKEAADEYAKVLSAERDSAKISPIYRPTLFLTEKDPVAFHRAARGATTHLLIVNGVHHKGVQKRFRAAVWRRLKEQGNNNIGQAWASIPDEWVWESKVNPDEAMKIIK